MATDRRVMSAVVGSRGRLGLLLCLVAGLVTACAAPENRTPGATTAASTPRFAVSPNPLPVLEDGAVAPGRYAVMPPADGWAACADWVVDCPPEPAQARSLRVEITVPRGWEAGFEGTVLVPSAGSFASAAEGPAGAGVVIGWTGHPSGLHADPCQAVSHLKPDIEVGPTVDEFVDAIRAHPSLQISEPEDVELGGHQGKYFELTVPSDISDCHDWRPFEPGIVAQGPDNLWRVWVIDVDGLRMIVLTEEFPDTPARDQADLRSMVESIRFVL
jgi:hypothetical protein